MIGGVIAGGDGYLTPLLDTALARFLAAAGAVVIETGRRFGSEPVAIG